MKNLTFLLILIVALLIVSQICYTFLASLLSANVIFYVGIVTAFIMAYKGYKSDTKIN